MSKHLFFFLIIFSFIFSSAAANDYADDPDGSYVMGIINGGEFTSAHASEGGCPGVNPPHVYLDKLSGLCGCPTKPKIEIKGCEFHVSCDLADDNNTVIGFTVPCPTVASTDPQYPLVKMLSGTLVEWRVSDKRVKAPSTITYGNKGVEAYGSEIFVGFDLDIVISTVDTGKKWNITEAEKIVKSTEKHSRTNIEFELESPGFAVEVMTPKDIYYAYKNRSSQVQAYLATAGKGWGERPWSTYEKFVNDMCKESQKNYICKRSLLGREYLGRVGNYYLGNGNPTILGVYSEASSHTAHGATRLNNKGEPAFGIRFESTFYVYFQAKWVNHGTYGNVAAIDMGPACTSVYYITHPIWISDISCDETGCVDNGYWGTYRTRHCASWVEVFGCVDDYIMSGTGESAEDCPECVKISGWVKNKVKHTDPYPISFYQSQPLLINENN